MCLKAGYNLWLLSHDAIEAENVQLLMKRSQNIWKRKDGFCFYCQFCATGVCSSISTSYITKTKSVGAEVSNRA